jgi:hypothetical protein
VNKTKSARPGNFLRTLGSQEEYVWLLEQKASRTVVVLAEMQGSTTPEDWRTALNAVQARHTLLSSRICKEPGCRPYLERASGIGIPLKIVARDAAPSAVERCARELEAGFAQDNALMRATIMHDKEQCTLILAAVHAAFDGRSMVVILRDLLQSLAGESLGSSLPLSPSQDELFGLDNPGTYTPAIEKPADPILDLHSECSRAPLQIERVSIEPDVISAIERRARLEQTTVHGALAAAILLAGRTQSRNWRDRVVRCASPIDNRTMLDMDEKVGLLITMGYTELDPAFPGDLWDLARQVKRDVTVHRTIAEAAGFLVPLRDMMSFERTPDSVDAISRQRAHALLVTNYGRLPVSTNYGRVQLRSVTPFVRSGAPHTQTVSVATLDARLSMSNVSSEPIPSLLATARSLLVSQS